MPIDRAQVRHVARLARLRLSADEEEQAVAQLGAVLGYLERLAAVDVAGVEPLSFAGEDGAGLAASLRDDEVRPGLPREQALGSAPQHDGGAFVVPRVLE